MAQDLQESEILCISLRSRHSYTNRLSEVGHNPIFLEHEGSRSDEQEQIHRMAVDTWNQYVNHDRNAECLLIEGNTSSCTTADSASQATVLDPLVKRNARQHYESSKLDTPCQSVPNHQDVTAHLKKEEDNQRRVETDHKKYTTHGIVRRHVTVV